MALPKVFIDNMEGLLGDGAQTYFESFSQDRYYGIRWNPLKYPMMNHQGWRKGLRPVPWCDQGYYYDGSLQPGKDPLHYSGAYYIQEPSAMTPVEALGVKPGMVVADLCGAPGGKSTQIGGYLMGEGLLVANDYSYSRAKTMDKNLARFGVTESIVLGEDPLKLSESWPEAFDRILVDAPCSGEGMFRKDNKLIEAWSDKGPGYFAPIQKEILGAAYTMLKPGGKMVYSTCTFNTLENEEQIADFLLEHTDMTLEPIAFGHLIEQGLGITDQTHMCGRLWPHKQEGEGHFLALMKKKEDDVASVHLKAETAQMSENTLKAIKAFFEEIGYRPSKDRMDRLHEVKDRIYFLPQRSLPIKGLRTISNGWMIGWMKKGRFEPSQAFANGLTSKCVTSYVDFSYDDERAIKYLKGESVEASGIKGWCLVCLEGGGMGWAKGQNNRLKNKIEPSWRWM